MKNTGEGAKGYMSRMIQEVGNMASNLHFHHLLGNSDADHILSSADLEKEFLSSFF